MIQTPAKQTFPTRKDFKRRFNLRLGTLSKLYDPITELLSDESERYLNELWFNQELKKESRTVLITSRGEIERERHYCPHCRNRNIYVGYVFCPKCGAEVIWQNKLKQAS